MAEMRLTDTGAWLCCEYCGAWREVVPEPAGADAFFVHWRAAMVCCGVRQTGTATREKDEIDMH